MALLCRAAQTDIRELGGKVLSAFFEGWEGWASMVLFEENWGPNALSIVGTPGGGGNVRNKNTLSK